MNHRSPRASRTRRRRHPPSDPSGDAKLKRILTALIVATIALGAIFGVIYYLGRHKDSGPSLADRAVSSAEEAVEAKPDDVALRDRTCPGLHADRPHR